MTEAQKQAHKEILWKMRTGQGRTVISDRERPPQCAVEQFRHKPYGELGGGNDQTRTITAGETDPV